MKLCKILLPTLALAFSGSLLAADDGSRVVTTFDGKPPFKRQVVSAAEAERMARDANDRAMPAVGDRVHVTQARARPPFDRRIVTVTAENAVEFARFEETAPRIDSGRRVGPPGKGFR